MVVAAAPVVLVENINVVVVAVVELADDVDVAVASVLPDVEVDVVVRNPVDVVGLLVVAFVTVVVVNPFVGIGVGTMELNWHDDDSPTHAHP